MATGFKGKKGTPRKDNPIKGFLRSHSTSYFEPTLEVDRQTAALTGLKVGTMVSRFDVDLAMMEPSQRVDAEIKLLNYHTPKMQQAAVDMSVTDESAQTLSARLSELAEENENKA